MKKILILTFVLFFNQAYGFGKPKKDKSNFIKVSPMTMKSLLANKEVQANGKIKIAQADEEDIDLEAGYEEHVKEQENNKVLKFIEDAEKKFESDGPEEEKDSAGLFNFGSGGGSKEAAIVVFAVVGLVVVFLWLPYFPILAWKAISERDQIKFLNLFSINALGLKSESGSDPDNPSSNSSEIREGFLTSTRYNLFMKKKDDEGFTWYGVASEIGLYGFKEKNKVTGARNEFNGTYWLVGPSLYFGASSEDQKLSMLSCKVDLMAGTSIGNDLGLISKAEINLNIGFGNFFAGIGIGALYFNVANERGILSDSSSVGLTISGVAGFAL